MYHEIRDSDPSEIFSQINSGVGGIFYVAFAIGYHFDKQDKIASGSINHVNLVSLDPEIKALMVELILKKKPQLEEPKELWKEVEMYAEYGIQVLFNSWKKNDRMLDIEDILGAA
jgi:hypothetical protein